MSETIRIEEYHTVGTFVMNRFHGDKSSFVDFSSIYDGTFETDANAKIEAVTEIVNTKFHINKIKVISKAIKLLIHDVLPKLTLLEKYVIFAHADINLTPKDYGFVDLRDAIRREDIEAVETDFAFLIGNTTTYFDILETKGFTDVAFNNLKALADKITTQNDLQESLKSDKRQAVLANHVLFDDVLTIIKDLQDTGKRLFKFTNKEKTKDYTMSYILNQIRQEAKKKEDENNAVPNACQLEINVTDADGNPLEEITTLILEYNLSEVTDADGCSLFEAVPTVPNSKVTVRLTGATWKLKDVTDVQLSPDGQVSLDVTMDPE